MNRFDKLIIENFQSHIYTEIDFHPGLNVFVGPTDSGKSAILRALGWVLFNIPRGKDFIRKNARLCQVHLILSDGTEIIRMRNQQTINRYILRKPNGEESIFEGFGTDVPKEILEVHQIRPLKLEQRDIWLQFGTQLENAFLLSETSGFKAKMIGLVSGAHLMDLALKKTTRDRKRLQSQLKDFKQEKERLEEKLVPYQNLSDLQDQLEEIKEVLKSIKQKQRRLEKCKYFSEQLYQVRHEMQKHKEVIERLNNVFQVEQRQIKLEMNIWRLRQLYQQKSKWAKTKEEAQHLHRQMEKTASVFNAEEQLISLKMKYDQYLYLLQQRRQWQEIVTQVQNTRQVIQERQYVEIVQKKVEQVQQNAMRIQVLQRYVGNWQKMKQLKKRELNFLEQTSLIPIIQNKFPSLREKANLLNRLILFSEKVEDMKKRIETGVKYRVGLEREIQKLSQRYARLLQKHGKCPTCGSKIHEDLLEQVMIEIQGGHPYVAAGKSDQGD